MKHRLSEQDASEAVIAGVAVELIDADTRLGGFTMPATKACRTKEEAVLFADGRSGVIVVRQIADGRWQGWRQRRNSGRCVPRGGCPDTMGLRINTRGDRLLVACR